MQMELSAHPALIWVLILVAVGAQPAGVPLGRPVMSRSEAAAGSGG